MISFLDSHKMINNNKILGPIPSNSDIYKKAFSVAWPSALESIFISLT